MSSASSTSSPSLQQQVEHQQQHEQQQKQQQRPPLAHKSTSSTRTTLRAPHARSSAASSATAIAASGEPASARLFEDVDEDTVRRGLEAKGIRVENVDEGETAKSPDKRLEISKVTLCSLSVVLIVPLSKL